MKRGTLKGDVGLYGGYVRLRVFENSVYIFGFHIVRIMVFWGGSAVRTAIIMVTEVAMIRRVIRILVTMTIVIIVVCSHMLTVRMMGIIVA